MPVQRPREAESVRPCSARPLTSGSAVLLGRALGAATPAAEVNVNDASAERKNCNRRPELRVSAAVSERKHASLPPLLTCVHRI